MKKFLKILAIIIVLLIMGVVALIKFVDPNEYRGYMVAQVEQKTGYKLEINGDLRWHIWPQISMLVNHVKVTAPGASAAMVDAENMRLDVALMPLFSKQLAVKNVLLKGAIVRLTDETKGTIRPTSSATDKGEVTPDTADNAAANWSFQLNRFEVINSLFILQQSANKDDLLTVRDINIELTQKAPRQGVLDISANINRDQQDLSLTLAADLDLQNYPKQAVIDIQKLTYQLKGTGETGNGLGGEATMKINYLAENKSVTASELKVTANGDTIQGEVATILGDIPDFIVKLSSERINVDGLLNSLPKSKPAANNRSVSAISSTAQGSVVKTNSVKTNVKAPVATKNNPLAVLQGLNMQLTLNVKTLLSNGMTINNLLVNADNKQGKVQIKVLSGQLLGGSFSAPGSINAAGNLPYVKLNPKLSNIDLETVYKAFKLPNTLSGKLNLQGTLSGSGLDPVAIQRRWQANMKVNVTNARLNGMNIQQIIQKAVALSNRDISTKDRYENYTEVRQLSSDIALLSGNVNLSNLKVDSEALTLSGSGTINLAKLYCDVNLNVKLMQGWQGKKDVVDILQSTVIPLRVYGPCNNLGYNVNVERILKDQLKNQASKAIEKYLNKGKDDSELSAKKKAKRKLLNNVLGGLL